MLLSPFLNDRDRRHPREPTSSLPPPPQTHPAGRGGHSRAILARLGPKGRLHAFDMDPAAIAVGRQLEKDDRRFKIHHAPFSTMAEARLSGRGGCSNSVRCRFDARCIGLEGRRRRACFVQPSCTLVVRAQNRGVELRRHASRRGRNRDQNRTTSNTPFSCSRKCAQVLDEGSVTGILFDLGISSPQFDEAGRGFRPEQDGPLDLRFDQTKGESAYELLQRIPRDELARILTEYGDGQDRIAAQRIADAICLQREQEGGLPSRTREFAALVAAAKGREYQAMHPAKLTFQVRNWGGEPALRYCFFSPLPSRGDTVCFSGSLPLPACSVLRAFACVFAGVPLGRRDGDGLPLTPSSLPPSRIPHRRCASI